MFATQPASLHVINVPKCCKNNETYFYYNQTFKGCESKTANLEFELIHAEFYEGCIEDKEITLKYQTTYSPPCSG